jgi:hypothetical protein
MNYKAINEVVQQNAEPFYYRNSLFTIPFARQGAGLFNFYKSIHSQAGVAPNVIDFDKHPDTQQATTIYISNRVAVKKYNMSYKKATFISINDKSVINESNTTKRDIQVSITLPKMANPGQDT